MKRDLDRLISEASGVKSVRPEQLDLLSSYADFLSQYKEANVIGTRDTREILSEHIADSVSCLQFEPLWKAENVLDIGSGGGLPAIPLSITMPDAEFVLVESNGKKIKFLREAVQELDLRNVLIQQTRVEEIGVSAEHRESYDFVTARALARLDVLAEYGVPLLKVGGCLISMKAEVAQEELSQGEMAAELLNARIKEVKAVRRSHLQKQKTRRLVVMEKIDDTPRRYPRRVGIPAKKPLGDRK